MRDEPRFGSPGPTTGSLFVPRSDRPASAGGSLDEDEQIGDDLGDDDHDSAEDGAREPRRAARFGGHRSRLASRRWAEDRETGPDNDGAADEDENENEDEVPGVPRRWRIFLIVLAALVVAGVTFRTMSGSDDGAGGGDAATQPLPTAKPVPANFLESIVTDTDPVVENEFFRDAKLDAGVHVYTRVASKLDANCPELTGELGGALDHPAAPMPASTSAASTPAPAVAATGAATTPSAAPTVTGPACRQLVRALYVGEPDAKGRRLLAGVSVLVVDNAETAKQAATIMNERRGGVTPLPLPEGALPDAKISGPNSDFERRLAASSGHYVVLVQVAYSDNSETAANDTRITSALDELSAAAVQPISERGLIGRGYRG